MHPTVEVGAHSVAGEPRERTSAHSRSRSQPMCEISGSAPMPTWANPPPPWARCRVAGACSASSSSRFGRVKVDRRGLRRLRQCAAMTPERQPQCDCISWPQQLGDPDESRHPRWLRRRSCRARRPARSDSRSRRHGCLRVRASSVNPVDNAGTVEAIGETSRAMRLATRSSASSCTKSHRPRRKLGRVDRP